MSLLQGVKASLQLRVSCRQCVVLRRCCRANRNKLGLARRTGGMRVRGLALDHRRNLPIRIVAELLAGGLRPAQVES